ncbi:hypothetical protein Daus18300_001867 [Diaporthe australafricana]|uniref:Uncharacterized protein n=1 Tax=Diaporthe australafricana TaxID=127596 RepID=A0ABR3XTF8_9PEZI
MKRLAFIIITIMSGLVANTLGLSAPIDGYEVVNITWTIQPDIPGAAPFNLTGTVEDVWTHIKTTWPGYPPLDMDLAGVEIPPIISREYKNKTDGNVKCKFWTKTDEYRIGQGIDHLKKVPGKPGWCNDNDHDFELDSFSNIADAASDIDNWCEFAIYPETTVWVSGQNFLPGGWNVIVRHDTDNC